MVAPTQQGVPAKSKLTHCPMSFSLELKPNFDYNSLGYNQVKSQRAATKLPHFLFCVRLQW